MKKTTVKPLKNNLVLFFSFVFIFSAIINAYSQTVQYDSINNKKYVLVDVQKTYERIANQGYESIEIYEFLGNYYYENNKSLDSAFKWVNLAIAGNPKAFWMVHLKAKIQKKMNDTKGAIASAEQSMALAREDKNEDYVKLNEKLLAELKK